MITGLIPHRYAKALYKYAGETGERNAVYEEMKSVLAAFQSHPEMSQILGNPFVDNKEKTKLLLTAANVKDDDTFGRFVKLVMEHKREDLFQLMAYAYRDIYRKEEHISQVHITTAAKISDEQMHRLHEVVEKSFKDTKFEYEHSVNPELIGGFVIDVDSTRMDASLSGELEQLRQTLLADSEN